MAFELGASSAKRGRATPNMNVTPLVDVVLVLLIIFMVITPLLAKQFWLHMPSKPEQEPPPETDAKDQPIVVSVTETGMLRISRNVVPRDQFAEKLKRVLAARGDRTIFFDAAEETEFGVAVEAMDLARGGGATTIAVLTEPLKE
jgi:biopolymer transport protein ExbD/biopolymer transport protein TolR